MTSVQDFFTSRNNLADGTQQIGKEGRLWYDPITNTIRVYSGEPGGQVVGGGVYVNSSPPETASKGELWFNTTDGILYIYLVDAWVDASPTFFFNNVVSTRTTGINYTATSSDSWIGTTVKNLTITLPNAAGGAVNGRQYIIADMVLSGAPGTTIDAQSPASVAGVQPTQQRPTSTATYYNGVWYLN